MKRRALFITCQEGNKEAPKGLTLSSFKQPFHTGGMPATPLHSWENTPNQASRHVTQTFSPLTFTHALAGWRSLLCHGFHMHRLEGNKNAPRAGPAVRHSRDSPADPTTACPESHSYSLGALPSPAPPHHLQNPSGAGTVLPARRGQGHESDRPERC